MPLLLASSDQMVRCPQSWGVPATATAQDVMGRVIMLEKVMVDNMQSQKHMELFRKEMLVTRRSEPRTPAAAPSFPDVMVTLDTPSKKRKLAEAEQRHSYAG